MKKLLIAVLSLIVILLPVSAQKKKQASGKEPLFGKAMASYPIASNELSGACFYLVGGHGGPDPGAIGTYGGHKLHEDKASYSTFFNILATSVILVPKNNEVTIEFESVLTANRAFLTN